MNPRSTAEPLFVRWLLILAAVLFLALFLLVPLAAVYAQAFARGVQAYFEAFHDPDARAAVRLTLLTSASVVPLNLLFGVAAAWALAVSPGGISSRAGSPAGR